MAALAVFGLIGAACADDEGDTVADTTTTTESADDTDTTTTDAADEDDGEDDDATTTTSVDPADLTASFRGVTEDTIHIGYPYIDFDTLNSTFGLELTFSSFLPMIEATVADLNERGGILGRQVEVHPRSFLPVGPTDAEALCVDLTEDVGVFAVLGGVAGPGVEEVNECFTAQHETILIGGNPDAAQLERARAPWITNEMSLTRRAENLPGLLAANDRLEELGTVAIMGSTANDVAVIEGAKQGFSEEGTEVAFDVIIQNTADEAATNDEVDVYVERARSEGVDTWMFIGDDAYANERLVTYSDEFNLLWLLSDQVSGWNTDPPPQIDKARLILGSGSGDISRDDPAWGDCIEIADEAYGTEVKPPADLEAGETNYWSAMTGVCLNFRLLEELATAAGTDLTNESFTAAIDGFGEYVLPASPFASLGPDKYDGQDTMRVTEWAVDIGQWMAVSEPYDAS